MLCSWFDNAQYLQARVEYVYSIFIPFNLTLRDWFWLVIDADNTVLEPTFGGDYTLTDS